VNLQPWQTQRGNDRHFGRSDYGGEVARLTHAIIASLFARFCNNARILISSQDRGAAAAAAAAVAAATSAAARLRDFAEYISVKF
jgi:hypothetical protein